ncbi:Sigma-70 region 2 [Megasphaera hutchinsoni]|uniref:Sigma-70 region 2 n=2 Tax=Megasphaera TaxID=906 RepID=A0A134CDC4_9FIRM|nr:Sigma-70 region 2 [Megasphaera hutchinsoni]
MWEGSCMLTSYLKELNTISLLSREEEMRLWKAYKEKGDIAARAKLIEQYQPLVFKEVLHLSMPTEWQLDAIQEGTLGLIDAVERFQIEKGIAFSLYAVHRIRGEILHYLQREGRHMYQSLNEEDEYGHMIQDYIIDSANDVTTQTENKLLFEDVIKLLARLPEKEQVVLSGVYLQDRQQKSIAEELQISVSYVYRLRQKGIRRIRGMVSQLMREKKKSK